MKEFCKEHYFHEIDRHNTLAGRLSLPMGIVTILGGALIVVAPAINIPYSDLEKFFLFTCWGAVVSLGGAIYYLLRSHIGFTYGYMPTPIQVLEYEKSLIGYYQTVHGGGPQNSVATEVEDYIKTEYAGLADHNAKQNDLKSFFLHRANLAIVFALFFTLLSSLPYIYQRMVSEESPTKVEIIKSKL